MDFFVTQGVTRRLVSIKNLTLLQIRTRTREDFDDLTQNPLVSLTSFELGRNPGIRSIDDNDAERLSSAFPNLTSLKVHVSFASSSALEKMLVKSSMGHQQQLRTLKLFCAVDENLSHVATYCHHSLSDLDLSDSSQITHEGMMNLLSKSLPKLTSLNLTRVYGLSGKTLENISSSSSSLHNNLTHLNLSCAFNLRNTNVVANPIGSAEIVHLVRRLPKMVLLDLGGNLGITLSDIQQTFPSSDCTSTTIISGVEVLHLDGCSGVDDLTLPFIVRIFPNLRYLCLEGFECAITDVGLAHLKSLEFLESLVLMACNNLSDEGLIDFVNNGCKRLSSLKVECFQATDEFIYKIIPRLRKTNFALLDLTGWGGCPKISYDSLNLLKKECPRLVLVERNQAPATK